MESMWLSRLAAVRMVLGHVPMIWMRGAEVPGQLMLWVEQGTTQADTGWVTTADQGGITPEEIQTAIVLERRLSAAGTSIAGGMVLPKPETRSMLVQGAGLTVMLRNTVQV